MKTAHENPILSTKLYIPRADPNRVARLRLTGRLDKAIDLPFTLICAPAGYGKTTLLSEWIPQTQHCVTWVSLDESDADPVRFWRHFLAALQTLDPQLCKSAQLALEGSQAPDIETVLSLVINELAALNYRFTHVFDDYHLCENPALDTDLTFLVEHLPRNVNVALASRSDPALPLARWRARRQMTEIRSADLRFSREESILFLNQVMKLELSEQDVTALESRTEGWISGLQLAALSIKGREDRSRFIAAFAGSHRFIIDYLTEETLKRQSESVRGFLLATCILNRMCGSLCDALTGASDGQAMLEQLEQNNLFIVSLDNDRFWYRYHPLFAEVLQARLRQNQPQLPAELHRRASEWYEAQDLLVEAVQHALSAGDMNHAARVIEQHTWDFLGRGEASILHRWLDELPRELLRSRPGLSLSYAWILSVLEQPEMIEVRLVEAESALAEKASRSLQAADENDKAIRGEIASLRARIALSRSDIPGSIALCRHALDLLPQENLLIRGFTTYYLGHSERRSGHMVEAERAYSEASGLGVQVDNLLLALHALANLAEVQITMGRLRQAAITSQRILNITAERERHALPVAGLAYQGLGKLHYEWNDLNAAASYSRLGIEYGQRGGLIGLEIHNRAMLVSTLQAQNDTDGADEMLATMAAMNDGRHLPVYFAQAAAMEARLRLRQGRIDQAVRWAEGSGLTLDDDNIPYWRETEYLTLARILIHQGKFAGVDNMLDRLQQAAESNRRLGDVIEIAIQRALLLYASASELQAFHFLERACKLAEPEGYIRTFIDEGESMRQLLLDYQAGIKKKIGDNVENESIRLLTYTDKLLAAFLQPAYSEKPKRETLPEPLSERELDILRLISTGRSNQEIAEILVIAISTVKSHINSLYGKLGTNRRTEALAIARELGLLSD